jgi:hypothetical protein
MYLKMQNMLNFSLSHQRWLQTQLSTGCDVVQFRCYVVPPFSGSTSKPNKQPSIYM